MQEFQQRVIKEKQDLDEKIERLVKFLNSDSNPFLDLDFEEKVDLMVQKGQMIAYSNTLGRRIARFSKEE